MQAVTRRKLEMGTRALGFSRAHPGSSAGYAAAVARLAECLALAEQVDAQQRDGFIAVRKATARKRDLRRLMTQGHLNHPTRIARQASAEEPELAREFVLSRESESFAAFRTAARGMAAAASARREALVRHGLSETVLDDLGRCLEQFDAATAQSQEGRGLHVAASARLLALADEIVAIVDGMNGFNRVRFAGSVEAMAEWESVRNVATVRPAETEEVPNAPAQVEGEGKVPAA